VRQGHGGKPDSPDDHEDRGDAGRLEALGRTEQPDRQVRAGGRPMDTLDLLGFLVAVPLTRIGEPCGEPSCQLL